MQTEFWALLIVGISIGILLVLYFFAKAVKIGKPQKKVAATSGQESQLPSFWVKNWAKIKGYGTGKAKTVIGIVLLFSILVAVLVVSWYFFGPADRIYTPQYLQSKCPGCLNTGNYISVSGQNKLRIPSDEFGGMKVVAETKSYFISIVNNTDAIKIGYEERIENNMPYHYVGITKKNIITGGEDSFSVPLEKAIATYDKSRFEISIQRGPEVFFPFYANPRNPTVYINGFQAVEGDGLGKEIKGDIVISSPRVETKIFRVEIYDTSFVTRMGSLLYFIKSLAGIS